MKKIIIYIIILLIALWIPTNRIDISDLEPVQAIWVNKDGENYIVITDTEDVGMGKTVQAALLTMKNQCEKIIYLDTAEYLAVSENCKEAISEMSQYLKGKVKVCIWNGEGDLKNVAQYMKTHHIGLQLKEYFSKVKLPVIPDLKNR